MPIRWTICMMAVLAPAAWAAGDRPPNVVFILADNLSYYEFGFHGNRQVCTQNIDRLARESFELSNWHADAFCSPSRASLLTGQNAMRHGIYHTIAGRYMLPGRAVTLAEMLGKAGYVTGIFGKWHLGDCYPFRPEDQGFATTFYNEGLSLANPTADVGHIRRDVTFHHDGRLVRTAGYCTDRLFDRAIAFIQDHRDRPFFCYLPTIVTHKPWQAPDGYARRYRDKVGDGLAELYGEIQKLDENVGRLLAELDRLAVAGRTIVVFMTDQGMTCNWREGRGAPGQKTGPPPRLSVDGRHRVVFLLRWPGHVRPGRSDRLTWNPDLVPTLLDLCGVAAPPGLHFDGRSVRPLLEGAGPDSWPDRVIILQCPRQRTGQPFVHAAVKTQRWRLMEGEQLTDALADPLQMKDVAGEHPQVVQRLRQAYLAWWQTVDQGNAPMARPVLGDPAAPATRLHAMLWHFGATPWHPRHLERDLSGGWKVHIARSGRYRIELRRYPRPSTRPLGAVRAVLRIGKVEASCPLQPTDAQATFEVDLEAGDADLETCLTGPDRGKVFSAYFAYVQWLGRPAGQAGAR